MFTRSSDDMKGRIASFESMGGRDGPGLRFVVFMQGCPLRCVCCHNPETWDPACGNLYTVKEVLDKTLRFRPYFGKAGGITVSGGEPLQQEPFVLSLFDSCKKQGLHTVLDTSGCLISADTPALLQLCDLVLLDIKYTTEQDYLQYTGGSLQKTLDFLELCNQLQKEIILRHVIIPGINDNDENLARLTEICSKYPACKTELLPFTNLCLEKYSLLGIPYRLSNTPSLEKESLHSLIQTFTELLKKRQ